MFSVQQPRTALSLLCENLGKVSNGRTQVSFGRLAEMMNGTQDIGRALVRSGTLDIGVGPMRNGTQDWGPEPAPENDREEEDEAEQLR